METVRLGFVGVGGIAHHHLRHLSTWKDVEIRAVCDVNAGQADKVAAEYRAKSFHDHRAMIESGEIDAVYVCVPPFAHSDAELLAAQKGLGVFVEKPLCTTLEKGAEINAALAKAGVVAAVGYNWRCCDITRKAREIMTGQPVSAAYGYWVGGMPGVLWWRQQAQSGGQLVEQTTHVVDVARYLIGGKVVRVFAQGSKGISSARHEKHDIADSSIVTLTFDHGCVCAIASGHLSPQGFRVGIDFILPEKTVSHNNNSLTVKDNFGEQTYKLLNKPYEEEDRLFLEAVKHKQPAAVGCTYADAFETHRICMAANKSMETNQPVEL
ncbi:MAG: Gfo/Idh/MocA family protein [Planctomycetota bacterium]